MSENRPRQQISGIAHRLGLSQLGHASIRTGLARSQLCATAVASGVHNFTEGCKTNLIKLSTIRE